MTARRDPAMMFGAAARWANTSIEAWAATARSMASGDDTYTYDPAAWFSVMVNASAAACRIGYEWLEYVVTGRIPERASSDAFSSTFRSSATRRLVLAGALQGQLPPIQTIDPSRVAIVPPQLVGTASTFHLEVDATGCRGGIYRGIVNVFVGQSVGQAPAETIDVVVQVP